MVEGIYYSKPEYEERFMWAFVINGKTHPAHFGDAPVSKVIDRFLYVYEGWAYCKSEKSYLVLPKDMVKWKDQ